MSTPWHLGRLAGFDTESTGVDVEQDRIVTACIVEVGGKTPPIAANWLINPNIDIPEAATAVHGITTEKAKAEGQDAAEGIAQLVAGLTQVILAGTPLVIMNAPYDLTLLDREARRYGVQTLTDTVGDDLRVVDPRVIDKALDMYRPGKRTLTDLCAHYHVKLDGAHSADADAIAACRVAWRLGTVYPLLARLSLDDLHKTQIEWHAAWAADFQKHLRSKGQKDAVIDGTWPLRPVETGGAA
ncbi:3'-5' exonuclease [Streptomyces sp. NBC_01352]|uniref:3'-5' exonuclease n=1 Tax=Streptomyces sp. NBC_01352 TaxID=2903834 RepID=UPI002E319897|nr:3'-5' exonuclease [Streptomyces sp. NBC_01352]